VASWTRCRGGLHRGDDRARARRASYAAIIAAIAALAASAPMASARSDLPPGSGLDQYVESVPGADGNHAPGSRPSGRQRPSQLSPSVRRRLARDPQGRNLARLARDPSVGAPARRARGEAPSSRSGSGGDESVPAAAVDTLGGSGGGGTAVLVTLVLIGVVGVTVAARRLRRAR
jgi:hypothetical protein